MQQYQAALTQIEDLVRHVGRLDRAETFYTFVDRMHRQGFTLIGTGGTRAVFFLAPGYVVKVDYDEDGSANASEQEAWLFSPEYIKAHLCPVLYVSKDDRVLVMPRVDATFESTKSARMQRQLKQVRDVLCDVLFDKVDPQHDHNYGLLRGNVVLFDYAS